VIGALAHLLGIAPELRADEAVMPRDLLATFDLAALAGRKQIRLASSGA
jgi:hypothetical protein